MSIEIREVGREGFDAFGDCVETVFGGPYRPESRANFLDRHGPDGLLVTFDGSRAVGTTAAFAFDVAVPGGVTAMSGVTAVTVLASHRRSGVLTGMMRRHLDTLHETGGAAVAGLFASEPAIYGRFGYGMAARHLTIQLARTADTRLADVPGAADLTVTFDPPQDVRADLVAVWEAVWRERPGQFARNDPWWAIWLNDPPEQRNGANPLLAAVVRDAGRPVAYTLLRYTPSWSLGIPTGTIWSSEVVGTSAASVARAWQTWVGYDLVSRCQAIVPLDDPILRLVPNIRTADAHLADNIWVRLVDVGRALQQRRYATEVDVVLDVSDAFCPWNTGRWRLAAGPAGATCARTDAPADLRIDAATLGAAYLGGPRLLTLAAAGQVEELTPGALATASRAFAGEREPFCGIVF